MTIEEIQKTMEGFEWLEIPTKVSYMISFKKKNFRLNFYLTTKKITIQDTDKKFDKGVVWNDVEDVGKLKYILQSY